MRVNLRQLIFKFNSDTERLLRKMSQLTKQLLMRMDLRQLIFKFNSDTERLLRKMSQLTKRLRIWLNHIMINYLQENKIVFFHTVYIMAQYRVILAKNFNACVFCFK
jgi:hypothetical protein